MHLTQNVLKVIRCLLNWVSVHSLISGHHYTLIFGKALDLFLHIAPLVRAPVVAPANKRNGINTLICLVHELDLHVNITAYLRWKRMTIIYGYSLEFKIHIICTITF